MVPLSPSTALLLGFVAGVLANVLVSLFKTPKGRQIPKHTSGWCRCGGWHSPADTDFVGKPFATEKRRDRVDMEAGVVNLPAEFHQVARLANLAGLQGFEFVDCTMGVDPEEARRVLQHPTQFERFREIAEGLKARVEITYTRARFAEETFATGETDGHAWILCLRCDRKSFNANDIEQRYCGACHAFHEVMPVKRDGTA